MEPLRIASAFTMSFPFSSVEEIPFSARSLTASELMLRNFAASSIVIYSPGIETPSFLEPAPRPRAAGRPPSDTPRPADGLPRI